MKVDFAKIRRRGIYETRFVEPGYECEEPVPGGSTRQWALVDVKGEPINKDGPEFDYETVRQRWEKDKDLIEKNEKDPQSHFQAANAAALARWKKEWAEYGPTTARTWLIAREI